MSAERDRPTPGRHGRPAFLLSRARNDMPRTTPLERIRNIGIMAHIDAGKTMDRVGGDLDLCVNMGRDRLGAKPVPIQLPLGAGELFTGVVDLVRQIEIVYDDESLGKKYVEGPVPDSLKKAVAELRHQLLEAVGEHDDAILHKYLEGPPLTDHEVRTGLRKATPAGHVVAVLVGAACHDKAVPARLAR